MEEPEFSKFQNIVYGGDMLAVGGFQNILPSMLTFTLWETYSLF